MARECRTVDEFFSGHDGQTPDKACRGKLAQVWVEARELGADDVLIEVRTTPDGLSNGEKLFHSIVKVSSPVEAVTTALQAKIEEKLDPTFVGQIRVNVRDRATNDHLGSYSRQFRPESMGSGTGIAVAGGAGVPASQYVPDAIPAAVRPWADMALRSFNIAADLLRAGAEVVKAQHPPAASSSSSGPVELLRALNNIGGAAQQQQPAASPAAAPAIGAWHSPASFPMSTPAPELPQLTDRQAVPSSPIGGGGGDVTEAQVIAWANANPDRATALVMARINSGGG